MMNRKQFFASLFGLSVAPVVAKALPAAGHVPCVNASQIVGTIDASMIASVNVKYMPGWVSAEQARRMWADADAKRCAAQRSEPDGEGCSLSL